MVNTWLSNCVHYSSPELYLAIVNDFQDDSQADEDPQFHANIGHQGAYRSGESGAITLTVVLKVVFLVKKITFQISN